MQLLNLFHSGVWAPVSGVFLLLLGIFWYQAFRGHNSEWVRQDQTTGKDIHIADKTPLSHINFWWFGWIVIVVWAVATFFIASDYKGV